MPKYQIEVTETNTTITVVEAESIDQAKDIAMQQYYDCELDMDSNSETTAEYISTEPD